MKDAGLVVPLYPLSLDLRGRGCLVVGGGRVAERKLGGLLIAGAEVTVVAPDATPGIAALAAEGKLHWLVRPFSAEDLEGMTLAFVATSTPEVNCLAASEARARGVWLNAAEDVLECDFQVPAVSRQGLVTVTVSTSGASPTLAAWLRDRVERALPLGIEEAARVLGVLRECVPREPLALGPALRELLDAGLADDLALHHFGAADEKITRLFGSVPSVREILGMGSTEKQ